MKREMSSDAYISFTICLLALCLSFHVFLVQVDGESIVSSTDSDSDSDSACGWCRRINPLGAVDGSLCYMCTGNETLCTYSHSIRHSCSKFRLSHWNTGYDSYESYELRADCSVFPGVSTHILLDKFIGAIDGNLIFGKTKFSTSCNAIDVVVSNSQVLLKAVCWPHSETSTLDLNFLLVNDNGRFKLMPPLTQVLPTDSSVSFLPVCEAAGCAEGFLRTSDDNSSPICLRCNQTVPAGQYCDGVSFQPQSCPPRYYCEGADNPRQPCQAGCECDEPGLTLACPKPCEAGKLCRHGKPVIDCPADAYCPAGLSTDPLPCDSQCTCAAGSNNSCPLRCWPGRHCQNGQMNFCQPGFWCDQNVATPCPAGTVGNRYGLKDESCAGSCGLMWTSEPGSPVCDKYSSVGIFLTSLIPIGSLAAIFLSVAYMGARARAQYLSASNPMSPSSMDEETCQERDRIQQQIRSSVDALVARTVKIAFPSKVNLSSILLNLKLCNPKNVHASINEARDELTSHLAGVLLSHPQVAFDNDSYPWHLPRWALHDPENVEGEFEIVTASNALVTGLKSAVEEDVLEWFRQRKAVDDPDHSNNSQLMTQMPPSRKARDEAKQSLIEINELSDDSPSSWSTVDHEVAIALRTMLSSSSDWLCMSALRVDYSSNSPSPKTYLKLFLMVLEGAAIGACIVCFRGGTLVEVKSVGSHEFKLSWNHDSPSLDRPYPYYWWLVSSSNADLFEPVTSQCLRMYGPVYFAFHIIACVLFSLVALIDLVSWLDAILQCSRLGRGCRLRLKFAWKQHVSGSACIQDFNWSNLKGVEAVLRCLSPLCLAVAIATYASGCIARLELTPVQAISKYLKPPPDKDGFSQYREYDPLNDPVDFDFYSMVTLGDSFIFSIIAFALTFLPGIIAFQWWFQARKESSLEQNVDGHHDGGASAIAIVNDRSAPDSSVASIAVVPGSLEADVPSIARSEPSAVVFHSESDETSLDDDTESVVEPNGNIQNEPKAEIDDDHAIDFPSQADGGREIEMMSPRAADSNAT